MAQTKRKRRSKHRGTAAGTIETRGRTGRPLTTEEKKKDDRTAARERRLNTPPTFKGSAKRASIPAAIMFVALMIIETKLSISARIVSAVVFSIGAFGLYVALGYYLDMFLYRRRIQKRDAGK
jgi:Flp pilus assembly protein TadB